MTPTDRHWLAGVQSTKTKFVRAVVREVAGFSAYERRVMELLRNSKVRVVSRLVLLLVFNSDFFFFV
jgi:hypothetical protein